MSDKDKSGSDSDGGGSSKCNQKCQEKKFAEQSLYPGGQDSIDDWARGRYGAPYHKLEPEHKLELMRLYVCSRHGTKSAECTSLAPQADPK